MFMKEWLNIITEGVINYAKPNVIQRKIKNENVFGSQKPTKQQSQETNFSFSEHCEY